MKMPELRQQHKPTEEQEKRWLNLVFSPLEQAVCVALFQKWEEKTFIYAARSLFRRFQQEAPE